GAVLQGHGGAVRRSQNQTTIDSAGGHVGVSGFGIDCSQNGRHVIASGEVNIHTVDIDLSTRGETQGRRTVSNGGSGIYDGEGRIRGQHQIGTVLACSYASGTALGVDQSDSSVNILTTCKRDGGTSNSQRTRNCATTRVSSARHELIKIQFLAGHFSGKLIDSRRGGAGSGMGALQVGGSDAAHAEGNGFVGVGANLERGALEGAVQQVATTEGGGGSDAVQFAGQRGELFLQGLAVAVGVGTVGGLQGQFTHALQDVGRFAHGRFGG